jgi:hypothetical protein
MENVATSVSGFGSPEALATVRNGLRPVT